MSAETNKQLMEAIFAKIEAGNGAPFAATLADNVVMRVTGQYSGARGPFRCASSRMGTTSSWRRAAP